MTDSPGISSFVIRIIEEPAQDKTAISYRGIIRHIQSEREISFINWSDVESFIQQYVPIHKMSQIKENLPLSADSGGEN